MAQALDGLSPLQLSGQLNSLPCSLTFRQEETISIIRLIEQVGTGTGAGPEAQGLVTQILLAYKSGSPLHEAPPGLHLQPAGVSGAFGCIMSAPGLERPQSAPLGP